MIPDTDSASSIAARIKNLPAPHTTRAGGAERDGHLGGVKARGGGRKA